MKQSARPTAEFTRHHAILPPRIDTRVRRSGWTVLTRFRRLYDARRITSAAYEAGRRWRNDVECVSREPAPAFAGLPAGQVGSRIPGQDQVDAAARLRRVARAVENAAVLELLTAVIVEDTSWRVLARRHAVKPRTVQDAFIVALGLLTELYDDAA